jgi:hypothetical protein
MKFYITGVAYPSIVLVLEEENDKHTSVKKTILL